MEDKNHANQPSGRILLGGYFENLKAILPQKESEMLVTLLGHVERFLGPDLEVPNRVMLGDLPNRLDVYLRERGMPSATVRNYKYRIRKLLRLICSREPELAGLDSVPVEMPEFDEGDSPRENRLILAYRLHKKWRETEGVPLHKVANGIFLNYQDHLLRHSGYKYLTARVRYTDLQAFWVEKAEAWELPIATLPEMKSLKSLQIGLAKEAWPEKVKEQFVWYFACCRGEVSDVPFIVRRYRGPGCEKSLQTDLRLFLGYLQTERKEDLTGDDLHSVLSREQDLRDFIDWHRTTTREGKLAPFHRDILQHFAIVLEDVWSDPLSIEYRKWSNQLRPDRVRVKFQNTLSSHQELLETVQLLLDETRLRGEEFLRNLSPDPPRNRIEGMASEVQDALMFAILCLVPIRISNLINLQIGKSLLPKKEGGFDICIEMTEFKSRYQFKIQFPPMLLDSMEYFMKHWRPFLNKKKDEFIFHTRTGGLLRYKAANDRMISIGKARLGLHTNPHHFRMLCSSAYLSEHPEQLEQIRQLLGHKFIKTTVEQYTHVFTFNASRRAATFARETSPDFKDISSHLQLSQKVKEAMGRSSSHRE
jgi:site-specific recombinase XerD